MLRKIICLITLFALISGFVFADEKNEIKLGYSGGIDVDLWYQNNEKTSNESNIKVTLAQLILDAELVSKGSVKIVFLYDETLDNDRLSVDEAWIRLNASKNVGITFGQMYLPFGNRSTFLISDPLVLPVAEYLKSAVCADFKTGIDNLVFKAFIYNADKEKINKQKDHIRDGGLAFEYNDENVNASISYISNMAEKAADQLSTTIDTFTKKGSGIDAALKIVLGELSVFAEYAGTFSKIKYEELDQVNLVQVENKASICAYNFELNYQFSEKFSLAGRVEQNERKVNSVLRLKNTNFAFGSAYNLFKNADIQCEYLHGVNDNNGVKRDLDKVTMRISYDF